MRTLQPVIRFALLAMLVSTLACGDSGTRSTSTSPVAPSTVSPPTPAPPSGGNTGSATITGTLASVNSVATDVRAVTAGMTVAVGVRGTGISAIVSPGATFVLNNVPAGMVELQFTGPGIDASAAIADVLDEEEIRVVVSVNGSRAEVRITDRDRHKSGKAVEIEGLITSINASTLVVNGTTINVPADAVVRHGNQRLTFTDLKVGQRVEVRGTPSGSIVIASEVKLKDESHDDDDDDNEAEVEGAVGALAGSCPSLTFTVNATTVSTDAATRFKEGTCSQVTNGVRVEVKGVRQSNGSINATRVELDDDND
jgi:Domain of unknown function (DUF5666)